MVSELFIPTLNQQGFAVPQLDRFSKRFTQPTSGTLLEIGAAFGFATLEALANGARVFANDLDERHLQCIAEEAKRKNFSRLTTVQGHFPNQLNFKNEKFEKILVSRVLHFFTGKQIQHSLRYLYDWLTVGGELIVVCDTIYFEHWEAVYPEFISRKRAKKEFPGEFYEPLKHADKWGKHLPDFYHFLDVESLTLLFEQAGFEVLDAGFINRAKQFPKEMLYDGRESVGIVGRKVN